VSERAGRAVIHDLGYKRYLGSRRPQSTRWRVIVRNLLRMSWAGWWRWKVWAIGAFIATVSFGAVLYVSQDDIFENIVGRSGQVALADAIIPYAFMPPFFPFLGFVVAMTIAAGAVARDLGAGAFEFYFSRPVRPFDYVLGKVAGLFVVMWLMIGAGPLLLSIFRLALAETGSEAIGAALGAGKIAIIGTLASLAFAAVPLGFSALSMNRKHTLALFAGYYFIAGTIVALIARKAGIPGLAALDLKNAIGGLSLGLFDFGFRDRGPAPGFVSSLIGLIGLSAAGLAVAYWRVARAERSGLGGG